MKYKIEIIESQTEDIVVSAKTQTPILHKIERLLETQSELFGYQNGDTVTLNMEEVYCFFIESGKVYALTDHGKFHIKVRLYQLEQQYAKSFVKINQSCLINFTQIKKFQTSIGGTLSVVLKNGYQDYISRRQLKSVKERMGF